MRCLYFIGWFGSDQAHVSTGFGVSTPGKDKKKQ